MYVLVKNNFQSLYRKCPFIKNILYSTITNEFFLQVIRWDLKITLPLEDLVNVDLPNGLVDNACWSWRRIRQKYFKELLNHSRLRADLNKRAFYSNFILLLWAAILVKNNYLSKMFPSYALICNISNYGMPLNAVAALVGFLTFSSNLPLTYCGI